MTDLDLSDAEIAEMFGGQAQAIETDPDEMAVAAALMRMRGLLREAAENDDVRVGQLADRLNVSPSVVSRMLRSEGDMKVSTAVLWARALGKVWHLTLHDLHKGGYGRNADPKREAITRVLDACPASVSDPDHKPARLVIGAAPGASVSVGRPGS